MLQDRLSEFTKRGFEYPSCGLRGGVCLADYATTFHSTS
jgi:hypothetical protein